MKKISQREARRLRKELQQFRDDRRTSLNRWSVDYPGGIHLGDVHTGTTSRIYVGIDFAQRFECVVVCKVDSDGHIHFYAIKNPKI